MNRPFNTDLARLRGPDLFKRFSVPDTGEPLAEAGLDPEEDLIVVERAATRRVLRVQEMIFHHLAQGELAGEPYLVSF